jgi:hypothetical protein
MSVIFGMQRKDLIGATVVDVDGRDAEGDLFDLQHITLKLVNNEHVCVSVDRFEDTYLDIETVKHIGDQDV